MSDTDHPFIPDWKGECASAPDEPPFVVFEAGDVGAPFRIEHGRDMMFEGGELQQDYNFIDYFFGDPAMPIEARYYLEERRGVSVELPGLPEASTLDQARAVFPAGVLQYLQRRFPRIEVLTGEGYRELWTAA